MCAASCARSKAWIAAPVICSLLLVALVVLVVLGCLRGWCVCVCALRRRPLRTGSVLPADDPSGPAAWANATTFERAAL